MKQEGRPCSEPGCSRIAAFRTRTKPAWCEEHITAILRAGGLEPLEPFTSTKAWRLTKCLRCGCEAHYRIEYVLDQNALGSATCRACYWGGWAALQRAALAGYRTSAGETPSRAQAHAEAHGFDYLGPLTSPSLADDPHRTKCRYCGRISAQRLDDVSWGCSCQTNPRRAAQTSTPSPRDGHGIRHKNLLKDSDSVAIAWWDHDRNDLAAWQTVTVRALREAHWRCPECKLGFTARVLDMTALASCPSCSEKRAEESRRRLAVLRTIPVAAVPELAAAWADEADPRLVTVAGDPMIRRFRCPFGHHPRLTPLAFLNNGCPSCRGNATRSERLDAVAADVSASTLNREIAAQLHPERNGAIRAETLSAGSRRTLWWKSWECGHEWQATPADREKGQRLRCPQCRTILDSLAYHYPELGAQWSPENPLTAWQVRPTAQTAFAPVWVCASNPLHTWSAPLSSRSSGAGCPECREAGKSKVELAHHAAAERVFGAAASGKAVRHDAFRHGSRWLVDIVVESASGPPLAIEYDGAYWHADKAAVDTAKSEDLLRAGWLVARLREHPLPTLRLTHHRYMEFQVHSTTPDPDGVIRRVQAWATGTSRPALRIVR